MDPGCDFFSVFFHAPETTELRSDGSCSREGLLLWELGPGLEVWKRGRLVKTPDQWPCNHSHLFCFIIIESNAVFLRQKDVHLVQLLKEGNFLHIHSIEGQTLLQLGKTGMQMQFCGRKWGRFSFPCCVLSRNSQQVSSQAQSHCPGSSRDFSHPRIKSPWQSPAKGRLFLSQSGIFPTRCTLWEQQPASRQTLGLSHLQPGQCDWWKSSKGCSSTRKK